jgi:hypothetical protein
VRVFRGGHESGTDPASAVSLSDCVGTGERLAKLAKPRARDTVNARLQIPLRFHYVLIVEWLRDQDRQTGAELHRFLAAAEIPSELVVCRSWVEVCAALERASAQIPLRGVPAVQLETHAGNPWAGPPESLGFGLDNVPWVRLHGPLSALNTASGYRMLVVAAACYGSGVMAAFSGEPLPAPFAAAVGLRTEVTAGRLFDAMKELYRGVLRGDSIENAVRSAQRELADAAEMRVELGVQIAAQIVNNAYYRNSDRPMVPAAAAARLETVRALWNAWYPAWLQNQIPAYRFAATQIS